MINIMKKRKWHYLENPNTFDLSCNINEDHKVYWSEFEYCIWCYECKKDIKYEPSHSIFPVHLAEHLGITFDKIDLINNVRLVFNSNTGKYN